MDGRLGAMGPAENQRRRWFVVHPCGGPMLSTWKRSRISTIAVCTRGAQGTSVLRLARSDYSQAISRVDG
jgi:hypothetical protein